MRRLTETTAFETDPKFSPRGSYVSFVRDQDLYAVEVATGTERRLTTGGGGLVSHGVAEFIAQEEMGRDTGYWWSPDEKHLAYTRVDDRRSTRSSASRSTPAACASSSNAIPRPDARTPR